MHGPEENSGFAGWVGKQEKLLIGEIAPLQKMRQTCHHCLTLIEGAAPIILKAPRRFVAATVLNPLEITRLARIVAVFVGNRILDLVCKMKIANCGERYDRYQDSLIFCRLEVVMSHE